MHVDKLTSVIGVDDPIREGELTCGLVDGLDSQTAVLFLTERSTFQPVAISVIVRVKQNSPVELPT